jgi:hypothetical protein
MTRRAAALAIGGTAAALLITGLDARAQSEAKVKIAFAGDSLVDNYWGGFQHRTATDACLKRKLELGRFGKIGTGLARDDKFNWPRELKRISDTFRPQLFVLSVGINDRQAIVSGDTRIAWGTPEWTEKYRQDIADFINTAVAGNASAMLIGLPAMRETEANNDALEKNKMYADAVTKLGAPKVQYVEPWKLNASGADAFASYGPDIHGQVVQIRQTDGVHFTPAGEDLLAAYLFPKVAAALAGAGVKLDCPNP